MVPFVSFCSIERDLVLEIQFIFVKLRHKDYHNGTTLEEKNKWLSAQVITSKGIQFFL